MFLLMTTAVLSTTLQFGESLTEPERVNDVVPPTPALMTVMLQFGADDPADA